MMRAVLVTVLLGAAAMALGAPPEPDLSPRFGSDAAEYHIGPQDTLNVVVWQNAELTRTVPVRPDGKISLPLLNDVQAAGLTPMELRQSLRTKLAEYIPAVEVSVIVAEFRSFRVSVVGKVQTPGRYELGGPSTVLDALAAAGGLQEYSDSDRIVVLRQQAPRNGGSPFKRMAFNYDRVKDPGGERENFALHPGDIIVVP